MTSKRQSKRQKGTEPNRLHGEQTIRPKRHLSIGARQGYYIVVPQFRQPDTQLLSQDDAINKLAASTYDSNLVWLNAKGELEFVDLDAGAKYITVNVMDI